MKTTEKDYKVTGKLVGDHNQYYLNGTWDCFNPFEYGHSRYAIVREDKATGKAHIHHLGNTLERMQALYETSVEEKTSYNWALVEIEY